MQIKKKKAKKGNETLLRHRIGNYELRISEVKCEIEDVVHKLTKHVYYIGGYEYGLIAFLLSEVKKEGDKTVAKTAKEVEDGLEIVKILVYMLAYTNLLFSSVKFRGDFTKLVNEFVASQEPKEISKAEDDAILDEMQKVDEMKEITKE